jgi:hypothetical protein
MEWVDTQKHLDVLPKIPFSKALAIERDIRGCRGEQRPGD